MEFWTRKKECRKWRWWPDVVRGLAGIGREEPAGVLLVSQRPLEEMDCLMATLRVVRRLARNGVSVEVASRHPSDSWILPLKQAGVDRVWVLGPAAASAGNHPGPGCLTEVPEHLCPGLHARPAGGAELSVCGCHRDLMILASHHLQSWCLGRYPDCPHWRGAG